MPDGWVVLIENDGIHTWVKETRELVLCKDCKHRPIDNTSAKSCGGLDIDFPDDRCPCQCDDGYYSWHPDDYWFCADGERKEDDDG